MPDYITVLGVKDECRQHEMTHEALAERIGVSKATIDRVIQRSKPGSMRVLFGLASVLGKVRAKIGNRVYRITEDLPDDGGEVGFEEFNLALGKVGRFLGCAESGRQGLGYAHLTTAAEAAEAQEAVARASKVLGRLFETEEIEPEEERLLRECVLDVAKPALTILQVYARFYPEYLSGFIGNEKRAAEAQLGQPA